MLEMRDFSTTREVALLIQKVFNVSYSLRQVSRILRRFGMTLQKPCPQDYRRPKNTEILLQNQLKLTFELLEKNGIDKDDIALGFFDESSPQTTANTTRVWSFGKPIIVKNTSRIKLNAAGFYAIKGNSMITYTDESTQQGFMAVLEKIKAENSEHKAIVAVLDNFRAHKTPAVLARAKELGIYLVFLPPYSPHLNPIEFIWKSLKRVVSLSFIENKQRFQKIATSSFEKWTTKLSFARNWITTFFNPLWNEYENSRKLCH